MNAGQPTTPHSNPPATTAGEHRYRNTETCGWSRACQALGAWLKKNPGKTIEDYLQRKDPNRPYNHACGSPARPLEGTSRYAAEHGTRGSEPCEWSLACQALEAWLYNHPDKTADDYPCYKAHQNPDRPYLHTCGPADHAPLEPTSNYASEHPAPGKHPLRLGRRLLRPVPMAAQTPRQDRRRLPRLPLPGRP